MKSYIGTGQGTVKDALAQALKGMNQPSAIIFIAPYDMLAQTAALLHERYPETASIGTIGTSLANGKVNDKNIVVLGFYEDAKTRLGVIEHIDKCPLAYITQLEKEVQSLSPGREDTVCIEYCTGAEEMLTTTLHACFEKKNVSLIGGTVFGVPDGKPGLVAYNGKVYENACAYALVKNTTGKVRVYKENIYEKMSDHSHFATKVDVARKALIELDGRPAADVYSQELDIPKSKIAENVFVNPIGRTVGEQVFISSMMNVEPNGTIVNYKRINKNDCIYFLKLGDYKEIGRKNREQMRHDASHVSLVVSVDCVYRYLLYTQEGYFNTYAGEMAAIGPHMGAVGGGEQFNNQHVNQTMVCAVFE